MFDPWGPLFLILSNLGDGDLPIDHPGPARISLSISLNSSTGIDDYTAPAWRST